MADHDEREALFFAVSFTIIPSDKIDEAKEKELIDILEQGGGTFIPLRPDGSVDGLDAHSHIISEHVDFPEYYSALDHNCHVVRPSWVLQSWQRKRQAQTRQHSPDPQLFFKDVILSCADLPEGDKDAIIAGVLAMGGLYSNPLTKLVTHVVSLSMDDDKCKIVLDKKLKTKIVLPHWFDDCLTLGKLINETPYMLPDPEVLRPNVNQPIRARQTPDIEGATSAVAGNPPSYNLPTSPSPSRKQLSVLRDKKILFSRDLNVNDHLANTLRHLVKQAGGEMTQSVENCDLYVGHYRDGLDYVAASRADKQVGNLAWFYNVINRNRWTDPLRKLLHYPVPRDGIPGLKATRISLSNYTGEARIYLENLVNESGAEFTKTMKQDNTHLVTAHKHSEKCDAAQEWNINIINHLWLEESYAKCAAQSLTNPRYTHFPPRTNLSEVVGQTPIDITKVRQHYFAQPEKTVRDMEKDSRLRDGKTPHNFRGAVRSKPSPRKSVPASSAAVPATAPVQAKDVSEEPVNPTKALTEDANEEAAAPQTVKKGRGVAPDAVTRTPSAMRQSDEKENETPPTTGGRASKEKARNILAIQKDDIALFQREMKRKGGVVHGGRRVSSEPESAKKTAGKGRKRTSAEAVEEDEGQEDGSGDEDEDKVQADKPARPLKKAKATTEDAVEQIPVKWTMMVTGDERWLKQPKKESEDRQKLRNLGIVLTQEPAECTMLCAPRILRTRKFIAALACAPHVVSTEYLDYALKHNCLYGPKFLALDDKDAEERLGFRLEDALRRAAHNARKLLRGWTIFVTEKVSGGFETYKEIITINGGTAMLYRGRAGLQLPKRRPKPAEDPEAGAESQHQGGDAETDVVYLISGTEDDEVRRWKVFRALAEEQGLRGRVVKTDWLINLAMSQRVEWDEKWELKEEQVPGFKEKYGR